jgi:hypothetical protein
MARDLPKLSRWQDVPADGLLTPGTGNEDITPGYSPKNSPAIFMCGGEPWLMRYCWRTQKC